MQVILGIIAAIIVISIIVTYKWFFIGLAVAGIGGFVGYRVYKKKKALKQPEAAVSLPCENQTVEEKTHLEKCIPKVSVQADESKKAEIQRAYEQKLAQFDAEIATIPRTDILISEAVERRRVRDLPEYSFSNITRKTKLASIFPLVCIDVETTGLYPTKSEIVEITAIRFDRGMIPVSCFTTFCKPKKPIPPEASRVNKITDDMVADAPSFAEIAPALTEYIRGCNLVGHNLDFDLRFLFVHGVDLPVDKRFFDTLDLAHYAIPHTAVYNYKLDTLCSYYGIWRTGSHRSLSDCYATSKLLVKLVEDKTGRNLVLDDE